MEESLFRQYVDKWFKPIITKLVEKINGDKKEPVYLFKTMLKKNYSTTLKWGSLSSNGTIVAADVVAMNSSLPLKKRDAINKAEGDIPKLGMKKYLDEKTMTELDILQAQNSNGDRIKMIIQKLFADTKKVIYGVYEQLEYQFLYALSRGLFLVEDENNVGVGIRVDFNHPDKNKFGAETKWSDANAKPIDDIERILDAAELNGDAPKFLFMDRSTFKNFRKSDQVKQLYAAGLNFSGTNIPTPTLKQVNEVMDENYDGLQIQIINRSVTFEKNGKKTAVKPWAENVVVFLNTLQVGDLTWGRLAEMNHPVKNVTYQVADDYILVSKYHKNDPLQEFTSSQALAVPVINDIDSIYFLDSEEATASEDEQTEGDAVYTYQGTDYTKQSVVDGLNATKEVATSTISQQDATLAKKIDQLSEKGVATFEGLLEEPEE